MAVVLTAIGMFLYLRFEAELNNSLDQALRSRAGDVTALVKQADSGLTEAGRSPLTQQGESFAQILDRDGRVLDATPQARRRALLGTADLNRAATGTITFDREGGVEGGEPTRLLATPVEAQGQRLVVVVGASLEDNEGALASLALLLAIGGPAALLLASLAGYGVASAALRPVEAMRRKAEAIGEHGSGERLPVPEAQDEVRRLGETLNAMLDRLEGAFERLEAAFERERTFVSDASHELRTPLAILKTEIELALGRGRSADELHAALNSAGEETDRLAQLAEDLLVIARSDRGRLPIRLTPTDAADLLGRVKERFDRRAQDAGRRLVVEATAGVGVTADPLRLEQALGNMLDNALRHGAGEIRLSARTRNGCVELHVRDEGPGFPDDFLAKAFERFTRADQSRARGGTGLGLAIVQAIASAHGGRARAANGPTGADVWIELPDGPPPGS